MSRARRVLRGENLFARSIFVYREQGNDLGIRDTVRRWGCLRGAYQGLGPSVERTSTASKSIYPSIFRGEFFLTRTFREVKRAFCRCDCAVMRSSVKPTRM